MDAILHAKKSLDGIVQVSPVTVSPLAATDSWLGMKSAMTVTLWKAMVVDLVVLLSLLIFPPGIIIAVDEKVMERFGVGAETTKVLLATEQKKTVRSHCRRAHQRQTGLPYRQKGVIPAG